MEFGAVQKLIFIFCFSFLIPSGNAEIKKAENDEKNSGSDSNCRMNNIDLALVLDHSGSIDNYEFNDLREFLVKLMDRVDELGANGTHIAAVRFASFAKTMFPFSDLQSKNRLTRYFATLERDNSFISEGTQIGLAMKFTIDNVFHGGINPNQPDFMLVVTDGESQVNNSLTD